MSFRGASGNKGRDSDKGTGGRGQSGGHGTSTLTLREGSSRSHHLLSCFRESPGRGPPGALSAGLGWPRPVSTPSPRERDTPVSMSSMEPRPLEIPCGRKDAVGQADPDWESRGPALGVSPGPEGRLLPLTTGLGRSARKAPEGHSHHQCPAPWALPAPDRAHPAPALTSLVYKPGCPWLWQPKQTGTFIHSVRALSLCELIVPGHMPR